MKLTKREREVIELVAHGESTKAIAGKLGISPYTVRDYLKKAMQRNDWHTRAQAVAWLSEHHCE
jgi:LuxR family transcriptional regulator, maltose regulon positive regulatory protein